MSLYLGETPVANTGYNKANTDLSNLASTGKNIANWSNNVTNCITEIPQDIKLELNNGTLTLKAGSKVYVPNGFEQDGTTPKFDTVTIASDIIRTAWSENKLYCFVQEGVIYAGAYNATSSGSIAPTGSGTIYWYDTTTNLIKRSRDGGSTWGLSRFSLPFCMVTVSNTTPTSIDQVFNGFGYIGSTVFALPGVKGLIPNGRNADGTLNNIEFTVSNVLINTKSENYDGFVVGWNGLYQAPITDDKSSNIDWAFCYFPEENLMKQYHNGWIITHEIIAGKLTKSSGRITSLTPKTPFHAVDYNDFDNLAINVLKAIYPVGAVYIGTTSTCPLASFFGTWTLKSSGIVTSVNTSVPVKGNNIAIGLTNGQQTCGLANGDYSGLYARIDNYGQAVGSAISQSNITGAKAIGLTTDATKSGIVGTVTRSTLSVNIWERTA